MSDKIEFIDTTAKESANHVQIRVDQPGPALKDGRRGRIIIEDLNAPLEVVRWLKSKQCRRADRSTGKNVWVWVNDESIAPGTTIMAEDDEGDEVLPSLPVPTTGPGADSIKFAERYQARIETLTDAMEDRLKAMRTRYQEEIEAARVACQEEVKRCDGQIEEARARLAVEREREDEELEKLSERRRAYAEERSALSEDLKKDSETYRGVREQLAAGIQAKDTVATIVEGVTALQGAGIPVADLVGKLTAILGKKAGV